MLIIINEPADLSILSR